MRVQLVPLEGGKPIEITKDMVIVGRNEICDIRLPHKSVSKLHCVLVKTDGLLLLRDLGSTNGTRVNGSRVRRAALMPDDQLNVASLAYRVEFTADLPKQVNPEEYTQHLDAAEVARLMKEAGSGRKTDEASDLDDPDAPSMQANSLPDVYTDDDEGSGESGKD